MSESKKPSISYLLYPATRDIPIWIEPCPATEPVTLNLVQWPPGAPMHKWGYSCLYNFSQRPSLTPLYNMRIRTRVYKTFCSLCKDKLLLTVYTPFITKNCCNWSPRGGIQPFGGWMITLLNTFLGKMTSAKPQHRQGPVQEPHKMTMPKKKNQGP